MYRLIRAVNRRILRLTPFGMRTIDGVGDEVLLPAASNVFWAFVYSVINPIMGFVERRIEPRLNLFQGQMSPEQVATLKGLVEMVSRPGMKALEIGSWMGFSTIQLSSVIRPQGGRLYCVDLWGGHVPYFESGTRQRREVISQGRLERRAALFDIFSLFRKNIFRAQVSSCVFPLVMDSHSALEVMGEKMFDFIFIDGDHRYTPVLKDIRLALGKLRPGGILCGHDCECLAGDLTGEFLDRHCETDYVHGSIYKGRGVHCGVIKAVSESFKDFNLENDIWWVRQGKQC